MLADFPESSRLLALVQQRQHVLKDAWLTTVGHGRPGMNRGQPLAEAEKRAGELAERIRLLTKGDTAVK